MTQHELEESVARATGESLRRIRRLGFVLADPAEVRFDPEPDLRPPQQLDWDDVHPQVRPVRFRKAASRGVVA